MTHSKICQKKVAKRRARLWEDTIVCTLRDMQWLAHCVRRSTRRSRETLNIWNVGEEISEASIGARNDKFDHDAGKAAASVLNRGAVPPGFIKLDGLAESAHGDIAFTTDDERFFLIEVKSEATRIRDEWRKGEKFKPKDAYKTIHDLLGSFRDNNEESDRDFALIAISMRAHLFAYWKVVSHKDHELGGLIAATSYIVGCGNHVSDWDKTNGYQLPATTVRGKLNLPPDSYSKHLKSHEIVAKNLFDRRAKILVSSNGRQGDTEEFGATFDEFKRYVSFLSEQRKGDVASCPQPIHAVILSTRGFFRVVGDTSTLAETLQLVSSLKFRKGSLGL